MMGKGWGRALVVAAGALASIVACGGTVRENGRAAGVESGGGGSGNRGGLAPVVPGAGGVAIDGSSGAGGSGGLPVTGTGGTFEIGGAPGAGGEVCRLDAFGAEPLPADLFLMFDQSSSMSDLIPGTSETWWSVATEAVRNLADNPRAAGIGMGIQYFPLNGVAPASCTAPYSTPEVPIGLLPGVAEAIKTSLTAHGPTTFTPSGPALQGAIDYARSAAQPGRAAAVVFVTDGFPTECEPGDVPGVAEIARAGMDGTPPVRTFVLALGQGLSNLGQIAEAGGTAQAFLLEGGNVREQLVNALLSVSSTNLRCQFDLPTPFQGERLDIDLVSLLYAPAATGISEHIPKLQDRGDCDLAGNDGEGWYYDDPASPTQILVCPDTCRRFALGSVSVAYGCRPTPGQVE